MVRGSLKDSDLLLPLLLLSKPASKLPSSLLHRPIGVLLGYSEIGIHRQEV